MFRRILIANRGEVAARVLRTCRRLGIEVVAVASEADRGSAWLADATVVVALGGPRPAQSYLDQNALIEVALHHRCAAVHPGWGFLSENAEFATKVTAAGLTFIGPTARHLRVMGDKAEARRTMGSLGLPLIPGTGPLGSAEEAEAEAERIGFPVLLKAVAGGGGRGMRAVESRGEVQAAFREASAEAQSAFGDGRMYLERRIVRGRHVEVQIIADRYGQCVHLGERECSLQRRHQKVVEEAPSPGLSDAERSRILPLVAEAVGRSGYRNAGTIEMLLDADGRMYFMEMNTRLQVEHPITEETTGIDLVEWQLLVAAGHALPRAQGEIASSGHAIELRINAEDPTQGFRPSPGRITRLEWPDGEGIRVDSHLRAGDHIPPYYDSMIGKLIARGADRAEAIERLRGAVARTVVEGVTTNLGLHETILRWDTFVSGSYDTRSLEAFVSGRS